MEDSQITLSTRGDWCQWIAAAHDSAQTTARMVELGSTEFLRHRGVRTVEIRVQHANGSRMMVWRGLEEVPVQMIPNKVTDNSCYVSRSQRPVIHRNKPA